MSFADVDTTRWLSRKVYNSAFGRCGDGTSCNNPSPLNKQSPIGKLSLESSRSEFFREVAKDQITQTDCEFHQLSLFDHNGDNDWAVACDRAHASTGMAKSIDTALRNTVKPHAVDPAVQVRQQTILDDTAEKIMILRDLKGQYDEVTTNWTKLPRCNKPDGGDDVYCPKYRKQQEALKQAQALVTSSLWNSSNSFMQKYVNFYVDQKNFDKATFMKQALDSSVVSSFQQQVIEPSKDKACADKQFFKGQERHPDLTVDNKNLNAEDKDRKRNYKKFLTFAGLAKMNSDAVFAKKYEGLRCQLGVDYGKESENIETAEQVGAFAATIALPELAGFSSGLLGLGVGTSEVLGTAAIVGAQVINSAVNLKGVCFGGKSVSTARSNMCSANNTPNTQMSYIEHDTSQGNCALGLLLEGLGVYANMGGLKKGIGETTAAEKRGSAATTAVKRNLAAKYDQKALQFDKATNFSESELNDLKDNVTKIHQSNLSDEEKIIETSRAYLDARISKLPVDQHAKVRAIADAAKPGKESVAKGRDFGTDPKDPSTFFKFSGPNIEIDDTLVKDSLGYHIHLVHELEHITQYMGEAQKKKAMSLLDRIIASGTKLGRSEQESGAIGAEWDFLHLFPKEVLDEAAKNIGTKDFKIILDLKTGEKSYMMGNTGRVTGALKLNREEYIAMSRKAISGYNGANFVDQDFASMSSLLNLTAKLVAAEEVISHRKKITSEATTLGTDIKDAVH